MSTSIRSNKYSLIYFYMLEFLVRLENTFT